MSVRNAGNAVGRARVWTAVAAVMASGLASIMISPLRARGDESNWPPAEGAACKPTAKAVEEAKALFRLGSDAFATSNYSDAIKYWRDAYVRDCTAHVLLKNLGKAYEADGQYGAAVDAYRLYRIRAKITGDELDLIDAKISNLSKRVTAPTTPTASATTTESATTAPTAIATTTAPIATTTTSATTAPTTTPPTSASTELPPPPHGGSSGGAGPLPWVLTIGGGAIFLGGGALWLLENSSISSNTTTFNGLNCGTHPKLIDVPQCNSLQSTVNSAGTPRTLGAVGTFVGLGVGVVGVILLATSGSSGDASPAKSGVSFIAPTISPSFTGLSIGGAF